MAYVTDTQLAASDGSSLVGHIATGTGAVSRTVQGKLRDTISVFDFIPVALHAAIQARTSTTDLATYVAAAIAHINSVGGGELHWPAGTYNIGSRITLCRNLSMSGAGKAATVVRFTHAGTTIANGCGFANIEPSNTSNRSCITVRDLTVVMTHAGNLGGGFYDNCGTFIALERCIFAGGKYGVIFDQTEVSGIYTCEFVGQLSGGAGLWMVNGADVTAGNLTGFTNQITVDHNCQFNQNFGVRGIRDDGGYAHYYGNNNYNGGSGLRFAGVLNLTLEGGEFESMVGPIVTLTHTAELSGGGVGQCSGVIRNGLYVATAGQAAFYTPSGGALTFQNNHFSVPGGGGIVSAVASTVNCASIFAATNHSAYAGIPVFDGYATFHREPGLLPIRTEAAAAVTASIAHSGGLIKFTSAAAVTYTVPLNATVPFQVGTQIALVQHGAGKLTVAPVGGGVTIRAEGGLRSAKAQYTRLLLEKIGTDEWVLSGDRVA